MKNLSPSGKRSGFRIHAIVFVLSMPLLLITNLWIGPPYWVQWVLLGWSIGLLSHWWSVRSVFAGGSLGLAILLFACATPSKDVSAQPSAALEEIHVLRSIREHHEPVSGWCSPARTGFEPFSTDAERYFSFWSLQFRPEDGRLIEAKGMRAAELHACFGPTSELPRQNFYAEVELGGVLLIGKGECLALMLDFPEPGLFPVRCHLVLSGLADQLVGGLLTTSTMTSKAAFGGDTDPPGYTQASIATVRLWRKQAATKGESR